MRTRRAEQLLRVPGTLVSEVASKVGHQSESSFSRAFLGLVGVRPGQYLQEHTSP